MVVLHPRGRLLKVNPDAGNAALVADSVPVAEEDVPRAGAVVKRSIQCARTSDGCAYLWIGRSKTVGTVEASSGLRFDSVRKASAIH
jgi:hypothetical protein